MSRQSDFFPGGGALPPGSVVKFSAAWTGVGQVASEDVPQILTGLVIIGSVPQTGTATFTAPSNGYVSKVIWRRTAGANYDGGTPTYTVGGSPVFPASAVSFGSTSAPPIVLDNDGSKIQVSAGDTFTITTNSGGGGGPNAEATVFFVQDF